MIDPTQAKSKADASHRLAEIAKTPRARELFKQLAEEYEKRARGEAMSEQIVPAEVAPSLAPAAPAAPLVPEASPLPVRDAPEIAVAADAPLVPEPAPSAAEVPRAPAAPATPVAESQHFLAVLKAFREEAARDG